MSLLYSHVYEETIDSAVGLCIIMPLKQQQQHGKVAVEEEAKNPPL